MCVRVCVCKRRRYRNNKMSKNNEYIRNQITKYSFQPHKNVAKIFHLFAQRSSFGFALLLICEPNVWFGINKNKQLGFSSVVCRSFFFYYSSVFLPSNSRAFHCSVRKVTRGIESKINRGFTQDKFYYMDSINEKIRFRRITKKERTEHLIVKTIERPYNDQMFYRIDFVWMQS